MNDRQVFVKINKHGQIFLIASVPVTGAGSYDTVMAKVFHALQRGYMVNRMSYDEYWRIKNA